MIRQHGFVRSVKERGFGFIRPDGQSRDIFFHRSALNHSLQMDATLVEQRVTFLASESDEQGRVRAIDIRAED